jgi:thiol-disulfide isomerase/thioredoxin
VLLSSPVIALEPGDQAPTFALRTLEDDYFFLRDVCGHELRAPGGNPKLVVLDFWALWCKPCHRMLPIIRDVVSRSDSSKVALVVVSEDSLSMRDQIPAKLGPPIPHEICVLDPYHVVMEKYEIKTIPSTFVISMSGEIIDVLSHERTEVATAEWLLEAIERTSRQ